MVRSLVPLALALLFASCSFQAKVVLAPEGPWTIDAAVRPTPEARSAWQSLRDLDATLPADPLAAVLWKKGLGPDAQVTSTASGLNARFTLAKPGALFPSWKWSADGCSFTLDRAAVHRWASLSEWGSSPAVASLLPSPGDKISTAEYRDLLIYLLGSKITAAAGGTLVDASTVELSIDTGHPVKAAPGSVQINGSVVTYRWPLAQVLALAEPMTLTIRW